MAFQQGLSGLNAAAKALDVVGNNVANSGTVGFKSSNAHFADVYAASMNGSAGSQVGIGTSIASVFQNFTQGNVASTNNPLDLAINGGGFFQTMRDNVIAYTRNGQYHPDKDGFIINDNGFQLMGYPASGTGVIVPSNPVPIQLDTSNIPPRPTGDAKGGDMKAVLNLDSRKEVPSVAVFDPANPLSYTYSTALPVYDTLGVDHNLTFFFVRTATAGTWDVQATLDGDNTNVQSMGQLVFDSSGALTTPAGGLTNLPNFPITTGAVTPIGTGLPNWQVNFTGTTSFGGATSVGTLTQGGYAQGSLSSVSVGSDGVVFGNYSNGQSKNIAQVVLVTFPNSNGLLNMGNNQFQETATSGTKLVGVPGTGGRGLLQSMSVEESNVDLTVELVNMITLQRAYQANAQTIKTQDGIMQTLVNLR